MPSPARRLASQSIHIVANPNPISLAESKLILSALQKFGEVVTFRNLKYDTTNTSKAPTRPILAIFDSPDAAKQALSSSPLTIRLPNTDPAHTHNHDAQFESPPPSRAQKAYARAKPEFLRCEILPSRHNHESALQRNPFHGTFRVYDSTYQYRDLMKTGIPLKELADETMSRKRHEPFRVKRQMMKENKRLGATSLMRLYREGLGESILEDGKEGHVQEEAGREDREEAGVDRLGER
ncbi:probable NAD(P)H-dependent D-xylose reductase xyl1 [Aspergillus udagawae]|uniref:Probable NAD(P)H-dependent D-xylose reductase xyl1 n=1 Tax=Aspergillus udagawae TaxID=91492 RepID=A0A8H3NDY9_9EURO|nr:probable NAD(P)H-dependent D-xylose reductase xyl1 [Aspergillus udagawae]